VQGLLVVMLVLLEAAIGGISNYGSLFIQVSTLQVRMLVFRVRVT
jgi:hypothetical protein